MSNRKYQLWSHDPCCANCARLKRSKRYYKEYPGGGVTITGRSPMECLAAYMCDHYWFSSEPPDDEMLCGGKEYKRKG